ncbi:UPF0158 family protein [Sphaerochaeta sp.]|uniref:UPF0158 family protein n=1 Tax=Sphaerochaeta sp. TaxID=1972642 RepID=UPI002582AFC6|nr:UPF0158 family protein [Sphaerochaeta sp.]MDD3455697.1 UPF0158 family protein [Sphaerochaeta sp.]
METVAYHMPPLTEDLLGSIIFAMEDQVSDYFLDLKDGSLISEEEMRYLEEDEEAEESFSDERFVSIPDWEPSDGFHLMEMFANRVRNPLYRERLLSCLNSGKGVFRKFKDALGELPVLERKWFSFKDEQLKRVVITWYREQEGTLGLLKLKEDVEDLTEDILLEDFTFETFEGTPSSEIEAFIQIILEELENGGEQDTIASLLLSRRFESEMPQHYQLARSQDGNLAAMLAYIPLTDAVVEVPFFAVKQECRGLGLFRLLFDAFSRQMARFHYRTIIVNLAGSAVSLERIFSPFSAQTATKQMVLSTSTWNSTHPSSEEAFL